MSNNKTIKEIIKDKYTNVDMSSKDLKDLNNIIQNIIFKTKKAS